MSGRSCAVVAVSLCVFVGAGTPGAASDAPAGECSADVVQRPDATVSVALDGFDEKVALERTPQGSLRFVLACHGGGAISLSPEEFAVRVYREQARMGWWHAFFNITSPAGLVWVALGFLGQVLFTGRMVVQWLASEQRRHSVVPPVFWWLSLIGASMLLTYFLWRKDVIGVLGQSIGWIIYARNLWFIHHAAGPAD